ncbi:MAG: LacI family transcriptional regulator [Chloroflexota bacterium]|nr:LacI family transcriptional regulator [Chloroflexota bacterium]
MATIHDVARQAGLSVATVSRALSGHGYVSERSKGRVLAAVASLGYVPNGLARGLKTQRSGLVALLVPEIMNSFYTTLSRGVEDVANAHGLQVILGNTDESLVKERAYVDLMTSTRVEGVILAPAGDSRETLSVLAGQSVPTVLVDRSVPGYSGDLVRGDSLAGAHDLTRHLLTLGHRRIALINGHPDTSVAQERAAGFRMALTESQISQDECRISFGTWFADDAAARTGDLLDAPDPPTAILAANTFMAIGALRALRQRGFQVPEQVALACFDDIEDAAEIEPFLTALSQPAYTMGEVAMCFLLERISGEYDGVAREVVLPHSLLLRRSCGCPAHLPHHQETPSLSPICNLRVLHET